jgi:hypothetical protein
MQYKWTAVCNIRVAVCVNYTYYQTVHVNVQLMLENSLVQELSNVKTDQQGNFQESCALHIKWGGGVHVSNHVLQVVTPCISIHVSVLVYSILQLCSQNESTVNLQCWAPLGLLDIYGFQDIRMLYLMCILWYLATASTDLPM